MPTILLFATPPPGLSDLPTALYKVGKYACDANRVHIDEYGKNRAQGDVKSIVRAIFHTIVYVSFWGKVLF